MVQKLVNWKPDGPPILLEPEAFRGHYVTSGHLLFVNDNTLFGVSFDIESLRKTGTAVPIIEQVQETDDDSSHYDISNDGTLVYLEGNRLRQNRFQLEWVDRAGHTTPLAMKPDGYGSLRLSPDGDYVAYTLDDEKQTDIGTHNIERGYSDPQTRDPRNDHSPVWGPSGRSIIFSSNRDGLSALYWKAIAAGHQPKRVNESPFGQIAVSWHPEGQQLLVVEKNGAKRNLRLLELEGNESDGWHTKGEGELFRPTEQSQRDGAISPDGNWIAVALESVEGPEIYVFPIAGNAPPVRVSVDGILSSSPKWLPGREGAGELLFSTRLDPKEPLQIYIAKYEIAGGTFQLRGEPIPWVGATSLWHWAWDIHPDGNKILIRRLIEHAEEERVDSVSLVENFTEHLKKVVPPDGNRGRL